MWNPDYDRVYLSAAFEVLEDYLNGHTLYWPLGIKAPKGAPPYPQLTPGNVLLALRRLEAARAAGEFQAQLTALKGQWGAHWQQKAGQEVRARLNQWGDYLQYAEDKAAYYHYKVRERVILELLGEDLGELPADKSARLAQLDGVLESIFRPGKFVWEDALQSAFPREPFWFLYGALLEA